MSKIWWLVLTGWLAISLGAFGQRESARDAKPAGEGWRFHSQINGHRTNMLVFQREKDKRDGGSGNQAAEESR